LESSDTTTRVRNERGMEMIPGLSSGMGAAVFAMPYRSYMVGEKRMRIMEDEIPTIMDAATPLAVVFFQKSTIMMAGRLADAATAKASPTRKETFIPLKRIPRAMAINPTTKADIFPARTFTSYPRWQWW